MSCHKQLVDWLCRVILVGAIGSLPSSAFTAENNASPEQKVRVVWQDPEMNTLQWGDLLMKGTDRVFLAGGGIKGFPTLNAERQHLVQMERIENVLLVGVRDDDDGKFQSGWIAVDLGVDRVPRGEGSGSHAQNSPHVVASQLDAAQGNPAHMYVYDNQFYLANDKLNGFTRLTPAALCGPKEERKGTFHRGGGSHITLAAIDNKIAYSTWSGRGEAVKGKIDVVDLSKHGENSIAYSFQLPMGGLHGAIANSGRLFFAPADGISWVYVDLDFQKSAGTVKPHHLSLGKDRETDRPLRTGAFLNHGNWILFTTGKEDSSALCLVDAAAPEPKVVKVSISTASGLSLVTPETVAAANGKRYAFVFQDKQDGDVVEKLTIVDLDPNGDADFSDAAIAKTLEVGPSKAQGHTGRHSITFDDDARYGLLTIPATGDLWVLSLESLSIVSKHKLGGTPTKIVAIGGK